MMKKNLFILCMAVTATVACQPNTDDNKTLDFDSLQVNFDATLGGQDWPENAAVGVIATCTRDGQENFVLSENPVGKYNAFVESGAARLAPATEADKAVALASDHNFHFYGIYPCPAGEVNLGSIPVSVPPVQTYGVPVTENLTFLASARTLSILPTIRLELNTIFSVLELNIPDDLSGDKGTILKSMEMGPAEGSSFSDFLAPSGTYNAGTGEFTVDKAKSSSTIKVDFGANGLPLTSAFTKVYVAMNAITIPEGGFTIKFICSDNSEVTVPALASEKEVGTKIAAGETYVTYVSGNSDGVIPVTFPVIFPLGYPEGDNTKTGYCNAAQPWMAEWVNDPACASATKTSEHWRGQHGKVLCKDQNQAYVTWNWAEDIQFTTFKYFIETANTASYHISTFGVKGVWTNDYFEFTIPVRKFAAGSQITLTMPFYTRSGPTFWEVLYKDGEDWKSTAVDNLPAYSGASVTRKATWALPFGGAAASANIDTDQTVTMTFENKIDSGYINIRVRCVDGSIVSSAANTVKEVSDPAANPFYFWNPNPDKRATGQAITLELK